MEPASKPLRDAIMTTIFILVAVAVGRYHLMQNQTGVSMEPSSRQCPFCLDSRTSQSASIEGISSMTDRYDCPVCGIYFASDTFAHDIDAILPEKVRLNCAAENIVLQEEGLKALWLPESEADTFHDPKGKIVARTIKKFGQALILHSGKINDILLLLAQRLSEKDPFSTYCFTLKDFARLKIAVPNECGQWLIHMKDRGLISTRDPLKVIDNKNIVKFPFSITAEGWLHVESLSRGIGSLEAFVAMSFSPNMAEAREAIRTACSATGWTATFVDEQQFHDGITDEILAMIKRSAFVIADFTQHKAGVYFEAGFGRGLGKPVIHTVKNEEMNLIHFDTKHLNHILWNDTQELERKLTARIANAIPGSTIPSTLGK